MSKITIERSHGLTVADVHARLRAIEPKLKDRYGVNLAWQGDQATISGTGVSGTVALDAATLRIDLKLGLLLRPLTHKIKSAMEESIDKALKGA